MSKGIIVVNMPNTCFNCRMGFENEYYDQFECYFKPGEEIKSDGERPDWCPIKPMPEKKPPIKQTVSPMITEQYEIYDKGWNACIDEIFKEKCNGDNE